MVDNQTAGVETWTETDNNEGLKIDYKILNDKTEML